MRLVHDISVQESVQNILIKSSFTKEQLTDDSVGTGCW